MRTIEVRGRAAAGWLLVVALAATAALVAPVPPPAAAAGDPFVHTPSPAPGELVEAGRVDVTAWLSSDDPITAAVLRLDGEPVPESAARAQDPARGTRLSAAVELAPGAHEAQLEVTDTAGRRTTRTWSFTAAQTTTSRFAGSGRLETAVALSRATHPQAAGAPAAVLARADDFADALAGVPLAASLDGPLLLSSRERLPDATAAELRRVLAPGATVHLLGGDAALGDEVRRGVEQLGLQAVRHGGADRFATAAAVADLLPPAPRALLASGSSFPDALAASAPAARDGLPILLTSPDRLPPATAAALAGRDVRRVTIVGGGAAVGAGVEQRLRDVVRDVDRVAGADRYATAVAVLEAFYDRPAAMSIASGDAFPDALAGARHAAAADQPLVLVAARRLPAAPAQALRRHEPDDLAVYGGTAAVGERVVQAALRASEDGTAGARVVSRTPADAERLSALPAVTVRFDRPVDHAASSLYVELAGTELRGVTEQPAADTLTFRLLDGQATPPVDVIHAGRVVVHARGTDGGVAHGETAFSYLLPDPVFAVAGPVPLHLPSRHPELVAFHESNHDGARQQEERATATPKVTLASRGRGTGSRSAADVVAAPGSPVLAPVSGRVVRAGSYVLYCDHSDHYAVIEPDARPGWEVKVLHFRGLAVGAGDRVTGGQTVIGSGPRTLPFRSQVDDVSAPRNWPHVHIEVVDPSIPDRPGAGC